MFFYEFLIKVLESMRYFFKKNFWMVVQIQDSV